MTCEIKWIGWILFLLIVAKYGEHGVPVAVMIGVIAFLAELGEYWDSTWLAADPDRWDPEEEK